MFGLNPEELRLLRRLNSPKKIQDFLETIPINYEPDGETCMSPRRVLRENRAHCIEGAMLAALALRLHSHPPLVMHLASAPHDADHVIALFRHNGRWGAISKTNHAVLRFRDPVYRTPREIALSFFHEYTDDAGRKTLRSYSRPINLERFDGRNWATAEEYLWEINDALANAPHVPIVSKSDIQRLRRADELERRIGEIVQWPRPPLSTSS